MNFNCEACLKYVFSVPDEFVSKTEEEIICDDCSDKQNPHNLPNPYGTR